MARARDVVINFKGADPVASTKRYDRIPEGTYHLKVKKAEVVQTSTDKPAIAVTLTVSKGPFSGKTVGDMFVLPRKGEKDPIFGVQRLHGLMVALGISRQAGKASAKKIAKALVKRTCIAEIADSTMPARADYAERTTSAPQAYYAVGSKEAKAALKDAARASEDEEEDEEDEEAESDDEGDDEDEGGDEDEDEEGEDEEEEPPRKKKSARASKSKKASRRRAKDDEDEEDEDEEEDEDLYDEDEEDED